MYIKLRTVGEQEQVIRSLRGWQWLRDRHGSLYDRGSADSHYGRNPEPHYGGVGGDSGERIAATDQDAVGEYMAGYLDNEQFGTKKDYT